MYEFDPRYGQAGMGVWNWVAPAVGVPAAAYALYRANQAQQQRQQQEQEQSQARGPVEGALAAQCRANTGRACSRQQISDICNNLSYNVLTDQHWNECRPYIGAAHLCQLSDGAPCSSDQIAMFCDIRPPSRQPRDCGAYISAFEAQQSALAQMQQQAPIERLQPYQGAKRGHRTGVVTGGGMQGLGWSQVVGRPSCQEVPNGHQVCFRTETVEGYGPEQQFARNQGCVPSGGSCTTSPHGNVGNIWCCPEGWPREPGSGPLQPGEFPPAPPGVMNKIQFWSQYWWFYALAAGVPTVAYLGYRYLKQEGYLGEPEPEDQGFFMEDVEIGAY